MNLKTLFNQSASPRVILLGSNRFSQDMIIALQQLDVEVIMVDHTPSAPSHQLAHRTYVIDRNNLPKLRELIRQEQPHLMVPETQAIATDLLVEIERENGVTMIPTARTASLTMTRKNLRLWATEELDLPTSRYAFAKSFNELQMNIHLGIGYPCRIKPMTFSVGQIHSIVKEPEEVKTAWNEAITSSEQAAVMVEEQIPFDYEITLLAVCSVGTSGEIKTDFCEPIGHLYRNRQLVESWQPQSLTPTVLSQVYKMANKIADKLGEPGLLGIKFFIKGNKVWFNQVNLGPNEAGMVTIISQEQNQFELHARAWLGLPIATTLRGPGAGAMIYGEGINIDKALTVPEAQLHLLNQSLTNGYQGIALATGQTVYEARQRAAAATRPLS